MIRLTLARIVTVLLLSALIVGCAAPATAVPIVLTAVPSEAPATAAPQPVEPTAVPTEASAPVSGPQELILATTTSTENTGLLAYILPDFETLHNAKVNVIAVGTGQALKLGEDGNADVLLVHARELEDQFMAAGHGSRREDVMYNDFVILGPESDPAGIRGMRNAARVFAQIAEVQASFVSRGDNSGTHTKEKSIWAAAGIEPSGDWYVAAGQGMGAVLTMANEQEAYTLSDRATYLARTLAQSAQGTEMVVLVEGDPVLINPYGVISVNPNKGSHIKAELATAFVDWLISMPAQEKIGSFGVAEFGAPLFVPDSQPWREHMATAGAGAPAIALKVTGKVESEMGWTEDELRAMPMVDAEVASRQGQTETQTGVPINTLLAGATVLEGGNKIVLVGDEGYTAEVSLADLEACDTCVASFRTQGGLRSAMPGMPGSTHVRGLIEIRVE